MLVVMDRYRLSISRDKTGRFRFCFVNTDTIKKKKIITQGANYHLNSVARLTWKEADIEDVSLSTVLLW